jgi:hypothetical protein
MRTTPQDRRGGPCGRRVDGKIAGAHKGRPYATVDAYTKNFAEQPYHVLVMSPRDGALRGARENLKINPMQSSDRGLPENLNINPMQSPERQARKT